MLRIQLLNEQAELNNFFYVGIKEYIANLPFTINLQILDSEQKQRLMAKTTSKMNLIFQLSDGTELTKAATKMFSPNDLSMWTCSLTGAESNDIVGGNFQVLLDYEGDSTLSNLSDATDLRFGMAYNILSKITIEGEC